MIFKLWVNSKFVLWQQRYYNLLAEEKDKKITFLKYDFFKNVVLLSISRNSLQTPSLHGILLRNFILSNSIILVEILIKWKRCFEIFLNDQCAGDIGNKNIAVHYLKNSCISVSHPILGGSVHTWWCIYNSLVHNLHVVVACLKVIIDVFFIFAISSNIMENIFNSISIYFWKKIPRKQI